MHIFSIFQYQLVTFNDYGPDITQNVEVREPTEDLNRFKQEILGLEFESFDGGRDSKERLLQGLLVSTIINQVNNRVQKEIMLAWLD